VLLSTGVGRCQCRVSGTLVCLVSCESGLALGEHCLGYGQEMSRRSKGES
jgi:hypothetical protein